MAYKEKFVFSHIRDLNNIPVGDLRENQEIIIAKSVKRNFYIALNASDYCGNKIKQVPKSYFSFFCIRKGKQNSLCSRTASCPLC